MGFLSFMLHRILALVLLFFAIACGIAVLFALNGGAKTAAYILFALAIIFVIASVYFLQTQH